MAGPETAKGGSPTPRSAFCFGMLLGAFLMMVLTDFLQIYLSNDEILLERSILKPNPERLQNINEANSNNTIVQVRSLDRSQNVTKANSNSDSGKNTQRESEPESEGRQPMFVLHVGPGKTGTTTVQNGLKKHEAELLQDDGYEYVGDNSGILGKNGSTMKAKLQELLCGGSDHDIIGSNEFLALPASGYLQEWIKVTNVSDVCGGVRWDVRVLVTDRRIFEVFPALYNQRYKIFRGKGGYHYDHKEWPGVGNDYRIPTMPEHLETQRNDTEFIWSRSQEVYKRWSEVGPVSLFLVHQEGDMFARYVCRALPGSGLCDKLTRAAAAGATTVKAANPSTRYLDHDILGVESYNRGLVHASDKRFPLSTAVGKRWNELVERNGGGGNRQPLPADGVPRRGRLRLPLRRFQADGGVGREHFRRGKRRRSRRRCRHSQRFRGQLGERQEEVLQHRRPRALELPEWRDFFESRRASFELG